MSKRMVLCYSTDESMNPFAIGYRINTSFTCNKVFREQFKTFLSVLFHKNKTETIIGFLKEKNTCVMALKTIYVNNAEKPKKCI